MKRLPLIIAIVFGIVVVIIAGVFVYDSMIRSSHASDKNAVGNYSLPNVGGGAVTKPKSTFPGTGEGTNSTGTNSNVAGEDVKNLLDQVDNSTSTADSDMQSLQSDVKGL